MQNRCGTWLRIFQTGALLVGAAACLSGQTSGQKTFATSTEAIKAFVSAARADDTGALESILGAGSEQIVSSGDAVADKTARGKFVQRYDAKHALVASGDGEYTLNVGPDDWPMPIPLVNAGGKWYFDGAAGKEEILYRRIGHNEIATIDVCKGILAAQRDYAATGHDGKPAGAYADRVVSEPGKQDGLYWETKPGEPESPAGPLIAEASKGGYDTSGNRVPYHGYYFRMAQNPGGFGFVAYPAEYRNSGVMSFVVTQKGVIYQKDLGPETQGVAASFKNVKLDSTWKPVQ